MKVVIPEIAQNVNEAEILALLVSVGEHVRAQQPVLELEADKASFEVPSPAAGRIEHIYVDIGDDVKVGDVVLVLRTADDHDADPRQNPPAPEPAAAQADLLQQNGPSDSQAESAESELQSGPGLAPQVEIDGRPWRHDSYIRASPAARSRARELGVDLGALATEFEGGRVTVEQIEAQAGGLGSGASELDDLVDILPENLDRVRRRRADEAPVQEWPRVPHLAMHDSFDVTSLEAARRRYRDEHEAHARLTLTAFVIKACAIALRQHPRMNSSLIRHGRALAVKRFVHVGVAVYTDRGLVFPVIKHADRRPLRDIAADLEALTAGARSKSLTQEQLEGATFTVTNLRGFGGTKFTPIIDPPQVGALGLCHARTERGRTTLPVSLAHDQRVNDEAAAAAFLATIADLLHDPLAMLLHA